MRRRKNRKFWQPVVSGLVVIYLATMLLSTYLVKERFTQEYRQDFKVQAAYLQQALQERIWEIEAAGEPRAGEGGEEWIRASQALLAEYFPGVDHEEVQISAAVYDREKRRVAQSGNTIFLDDLSGDSEENVPLALFDLDEYMSREEIGKLASYQWKNIQGQKERRPPEYRILARIFPEEKELKEILVQQVTWEDEEEYKGEPYMDPVTGGGHSMSYENGAYDGAGEETGRKASYVETASQVVWKWENTKAKAAQEKEPRVDEANVTFPYLKGSDYESWHRWYESGYLHDFPREGEFLLEEWMVDPPMEVVADGLKFRGKYSWKIGPSAYMEIRMECSPWAAALGYMKYLYLWGAVLVLVCMWKILHVFREVYNRKAALEETRRDFTNAMAHELKTPLGVIRNFAENLLEHNQEEKREYYLTQIIGQTEEMDHLVVEMIEVSKLDSEDLALKKENVSFSELIREQMERFTPMIQEKNIQVEFLGDGDFQVEGDREYLARAIWNLLSNAVSYNIPDGRIRVKTEKGSCSIENTGRPMEEEQLRHAFDLFYTGNESRGGKEKHLGMGLFLARKILGLHGLTLTVENGGDGVRAVIRG